MSPRPRHRLLADRLHQQPLCRETFEHLRFSLEPAFEPTRHTRCAYAVLLPDATPCLVCPPHARPILPLDGGARARVIGLSSYQRHGRLSRHGRLLPSRQGSALRRGAARPSWRSSRARGAVIGEGATPDSQPADAPRVWGCTRSAGCWRSVTQGSGYNPSPVRCSAARRQGVTVRPLQQSGSSTSFSARRHTLDMTCAVVWPGRGSGRCSHDQPPRLGCGPVKSMLSSLL